MTTIQEKNKAFVLEAFDTLVGHSYGAAVALIAALATPGRVRAMALYEPTLFALLDAEIVIVADSSHT
jgi:pimeloyl-ACP methyl ester carboxylesterase